MSRSVGRFLTDVVMEDEIRSAVHHILSQGDADVYPITAEESAQLDVVIDECVDGLRRALGLDEDGHRVTDDEP